MNEFIQFIAGIGLWFLGFLRDLLIVSCVLIVVMIIVGVYHNVKERLKNGKDKGTTR